MEAQNWVTAEVNPCVMEMLSPWGLFPLVTHLFEASAGPHPGIPSPSLPVPVPGSRQH